MVLLDLSSSSTTTPQAQFDNVLYIALQTNMTDLSVSQAETPGETINYCVEEYGHLLRCAG